VVAIIYLAGFSTMLKTGLNNGCYFEQASQYNAHYFDHADAAVLKFTSYYYVHAAALLILLAS
jgi:hypothetical protein